MNKFLTVGIFLGSVAIIVVILTFLIIFLLRGEKTSSSDVVASSEETSSEITASSEVVASSSCPSYFCSGVLKTISFSQSGTQYMNASTLEVYDGEEITTWKDTTSTIRLVLVDGCQNIYRMQSPLYGSGCYLYLRNSGSEKVLFQGEGCLVSPSDFIFAKQLDGTFSIESLSDPGFYLVPVSNSSDPNRFILSTGPFYYTISEDLSCP